MKSHALILGAAVSLIGLGALAQPLPDDRPTAPPERPVPIDESPTYQPEPRGDADEEGDVLEKAEGRSEAVDRARAMDERQTRRDRPPSWIGIAIMAGGGVGGFFDDSLAAATSTTGMWQVRAVVGSRRHFAGEMAYLGGAQNVNTLGVDRNARMINNGFEGAFRWNVLTGLIQPYAIGGVGYQHYSIRDEQVQTADVQSYGDVLNFPLGAGLAFKPGPFTIDGRVTFRPATNSGLLRNSNLSTWDLGAHAGFEF